MKRVLAAALLLTSATGCIPVVAGGAATGGYVGAQERSVGTSIDDRVIWTEIKHYFLQADVYELLNAVNVEVNEGRVLLTGSVINPQTRQRAVELAWRPKGVKEVINEIQITDKQSIKSFATDSWITSQLKSKMVLDKNIRSINYSVETINGIVYLMGIAKDEQELNAVTNIASTIRGVSQVISHVRIKQAGE